MDYNALFNGSENGTISVDQLDGLLKSLNAGDYNVAPNTLTQGGALAMESLDSSLKAVTFEMKNLKLWPRIAKEKAYNVFEEYNRQTSYGESSNGGFFDANAGTTPNESTSGYNRQGQYVKYMGSTRIVALPLTMIRPAHGPIIAREIKNGTVDLLGKMERNLFEANGYFQSSTGTFTGAAGDVNTNPAKYNGLEQQIRNGNFDSTAQYTGWEAYGGTASTIKDLAGVSPDEDAIEDVAANVLINNGSPDTMMVDPLTHRDLSKIFYPKERIPSMGVSNGQAGFVLNKFMTSAGELNLVSDIFLRPKYTPLTVAQTGAPATPVVSGTTTEVDATAELSGTFYYRVSAFNDAGESLATAEASQAVTVGNRAKITIAAGTAGAKYYACFRSSVSGSGWKFIGYVKDTNTSGGAGAIFRDAGHKVPGAPTGFLLDLNAEKVSFRQLAPMMKMDLATIGTAYRWMQMIFGTPIVYTPLHHGLWDNVGRAS